MTKKNIKLILGSFAATMLLAACNDNDIESAVITTTFEVHATFPSRSTETEKFPQQTWYEDSKLAAYRTTSNSTAKATLTQQSGDTFSGNITSQPDTEAKFTLLYPSSAYTPTTSDTLTQALSLSEQAGTIEGIAQHDYLWTTFTTDISEAPSTVTCEMTSLVGIHKFQFTTPEGIAIDNINQVIITSPSDKLYTKNTLYMAYGTFSSKTPGSITIHNSTGISNGIHVAFFPCNTQLHFTLTTTDGKAYEAITPESISIESGSYYIHEPLTCSPLPLAQIGDYFYDDATWSTQIDYGKNCLGVVFALEDESGEINNQLSTSAHGRVVALTDTRLQVAWSSDVEDIAGIENVEFAFNTLTTGSLPYFQGNPNLFFSEKEAEQLSQISINPSTGQITSWCDSGVLNDFNGRQHTLATSSQYSAAYYCTTHNQDISNWYLPAAGELALIWLLQQSGIICNDKQKKFKDLSEFGYWCSCEYDENKAWYINFYSGEITAYNKLNKYNLRAVIKF